MFDDHDVSQLQLILCNNNNKVFIVALKMFESNQESFNLSGEQSH